ncbi:MAG: peptidylprolyl isomerase [Candidatus Hermodarchaeota archaeon]
MPIKKGDRVRIEWIGTLEDGTIFDSSENYGEPLEFDVGAGQVITGLENAVIGMEKGEEKEIMLQPSEAYGEHNPDLVVQGPRNEFSKGQELKPGERYLVKIPPGYRSVLIIEVTEETVVLDLNHSLAGKILNFKIKIVDIIPDFFTVE